MYEIYEYASFKVGRDSEELRSKIRHANFSNEVHVEVRG